MTIDTSREAVERLLDGVTGDLSQGFLLDTAETRRWSQDEREKANASEKCNVFSGFRADDAGKSRQHVASFHRPEDAAFFAKARDLITALLAEVARLSTPPDNAEVRVLESWLRNPWLSAKDNADRGPLPEWLYSLMQQAADHLTRLSQALAAETAKQEAMEAELHSVEVDLAEAEDKFHIASFYISDEQTKNCVMDRVKWMAKAGRRVRETLANHGSK